MADRSRSAFELRTIAQESQRREQVNEKLKLLRQNREELSKQSDRDEVFQMFSDRPPEPSYASISLRKDNALDLMTARIKSHQDISDEEDSQNAEAFERFKQLIDRDRLLGQKLYS
jgi:exopolysaccharide biosynthesis predicted pyruvyltransferase EpsI